MSKTAFFGLKVPRFCPEVKMSMECWRNDIDRRKWKFSYILHPLCGEHVKSYNEIVKIQFLISHDTGAVFQVSEYLKKQMVAADQEGVAESDEVKRMLEDHDKLVEEIFQHEDKDKNGFISHDEFSGPKHDEL
jgi:hypothetical protein